MKPSLFSLFERSNYHSPSAANDAEGDDAEALEKKWNQCERFAVAAIGYCLNNNADFRAHFLRTICDAPEGDLSTSCEILIEDKLWGDLVLMSERKVYVIECKINAPLENHQNPSEDKFWQQGYGKKMIDRFPNVETTLRYIVLGYQPTLEPRNGPRIKWWQKRWGNLDGFSGSPMISDLYDSLGNLGVTRFRSRISNNMKKSNIAKDACEAFAALRSAYDSLNLGQDKFSPEIDYSSDGDWWYFGLAIKSSRRDVDLRSNHGKLQDAVKPTGPEIGWFGYQQNDPESGVCFAVWFYYGDGAGKELERRLKKNVTPKGYVNLHPNDDPPAIEVRMPKSTAEQDIREGDKDWFVKIIKAALKD